MSRQQGLSSCSDVDTSVIEKLYVFTVCISEKSLCRSSPLIPYPKIYLVNEKLIVDQVSSRNNVIAI